MVGGGRGETDGSYSFEGGAFSRPAGKLKKGGRDAGYISPRRMPSYDPSGKIKKKSRFDHPYPVYYDLKKASVTRGTVLNISRASTRERRGDSEKARARKPAHPRSKEKKEKTGGPGKKFNRNTRKD